MKLGGLDRDVRHSIYAGLAHDGRCPTIDELAAAHTRDAPAIRASLRRLADAHVLVLAGDDVEMALPFSAVERPHSVSSAGCRYFANCAWDGFGILAALGRTGTVHSVCPDCDEPLAITVTDHGVSGAAIAHFIVPARAWWDDIRFT